MAEHEFLTLLEIQEEFATCDICQEAFDSDARSPRALPCSHSFCLACLDTIWGKSKSGLECPKCRRVWPIEEDVKTTFHQNNVLMNLVEYLAVKNKPGNVSCWRCPTSQKASVCCIDCQKYMCSSCLEYHSRLLAEHQTVSLSEFIKSPQTFFQQNDVCRDHANLIRDLFCKNETCLTAVCVSCMYVHHKNHEICNLKDIYEERKKEVTSALDDLLKSTAVSNMYRDSLAGQKQTLETKQQCMLQFVDDTTNEIIEKLKRKTNQMKEDIVVNITRQQADRDTQLQAVDQAEEIKADHVLYCKQALTFTRAAEFTVMSHDLVTKSKSLAETPDLFDMQIQDVILDLATFDKINEILPNTAEMYDVHQIRPCIDVADLYIGEDSDFLKVTLLQREDDFEHGPVLLQAVILDPTENECKVHQNFTSIYNDGGSLSYRAEAIGSYRAFVSLNGRRLTKQSIDFHAVEAGTELMRKLLIGLDGQPGNVRELSLPSVQFDKERLNWERRSINDDGFLTNDPSPQPEFENPSRLRQFCGVTAKWALHGPGCFYWQVKVRKQILESEERGFVGVQTGVCLEHACDEPDFDKNQNGCCVEVRTCTEHNSCICLYVFSRAEFCCDLPVTSFKADLVLDIDLGFLLDFDNRVLHVMNVHNNEVVYSIRDVEADQSLMPVFGVYSPSLFNTQIKVESGRDLKLDSALLGILSTLIQPEPNPVI